MTKKESEGKGGAPMNDEDLLRLVQSACREAGWLFAATVDDVLREEKTQANEPDPDPLPKRLEDPEIVWREMQEQKPSDRFSFFSDRETQENLARAARLGAMIPDEILNLMHQDRIKAEDDIEPNG